jgi:predicted ATPase
MIKIGLQNFRKFKQLPLIDIAGITFFVGPNNSGKSTVVKALLLFNNYIKSNDFRKFSFGNKILEDTNIVTYGRAKNHNAETNLIILNYKFGKYQTEVHLTGEEMNTFADVVILYLSDEELGISYKFNLITRSVTITMKNSLGRNPKDELTKFNFEKRLVEIESAIRSAEFSKKSREYIELITEKESIQSRYDAIIRNESMSRPEISTIEGEIHSNLTLIEVIEDIINLSQERYNEISNSNQESEIESSEFQNLKAFHDFGFLNIYHNNFKNVIDYFEDINFFYLSSSNFQQSTLYSIRDKNNKLAQAINRFVQFKIIHGEIEFNFIQRWMKEFEIGSNFEIELIAGEAYQFRIVEDNKTINLSDKGLGSIQIMTILMNISIAIKNKRLSLDYDAIFNNNTSIYTIIIEEPEANLHPAFQSKLVDLFYEVYSNHGIHFLVETHSEYILRRSQVIVAENEFEVEPNENPFCVHYFPKDIQQMPYKLEYQEDGSFNRNFGDGFFDEASSSTLKLLKLKRQKKA